MPAAFHSNCASGVSLLAGSCSCHGPYRTSTTDLRGNGPGFSLPA